MKDGDGSGVPKITSTEGERAAEIAIRERQQKARAAAVGDPEPPQQSQEPTGKIVLNRTGWYKMDLPFKVVKHNPVTNKYDVITSEKSFIKAYTFNGGTHVVQTHGTAAEVEQQARGTSSGPGEMAKMGTRAAAGLLIAGPFGAAVGALMGGQRTYELPTPIITPKAETNGDRRLSTVP